MMNYFFGTYFAASTRGFYFRRMGSLQNVAELEADLARADT